MGMKRRGFSFLRSRSPLQDGKNERPFTSKGSFMEKGLLTRTMSSFSSEEIPVEHSDKYNYALLIALYTVQGIPMGLSASIPFLIQQKMKTIAQTAAAIAVDSSTATDQVAKLSYNANAIFALCSWPFSLKLLWAPIVDALYLTRFGRRKTWLVPIQTLAGCIMVTGSNFVERQLDISTPQINVKGMTCFFFLLYFLMATQDICVDGWALTMLSKKNRSRGPLCNSIGQNLGYFLSFVGFLALNDVESSETLWRPLLRLPSKPDMPLVSCGGFIKFMGCFMLVVTTYVALFKREENTPIVKGTDVDNKKRDDDDELDAAQLGLKETYHRLWAVCKLPAVQLLFLILLTYRLPTALSDNVKFLKAVEFGLSKSTTALLSPTVVLPLGIAVPIVASRIWHSDPLRQFLTAYKMRVTLVPFLDVCMLLVIRRQHSAGWLFWTIIVSSTAMQAIVNSLQFNAQMTFFASRVDPAIGGSYMTLLNTAANLGGTWPNPLVMYLVGKLTIPSKCSMENETQVCTQGRDAYFPLQAIFSVLGCLWILFFSSKVTRVAELPDDAWRTHLLDGEEDTGSNNGDIESPTRMELWRRKDSKVE